MKAHLSKALLDMSEETPLADITVAGLTERAGVSRRVFYNYFSDINDCISYTASRPLLSGEHPYATVENYLAFLRFIKQHPTFYCQLPHLEGQNNFRQAYTDWMRRTYRGFFVDKDLPQKERVYRETLVDIFVVGATNFMFEWLEGGMEMPEDEVMRIVFDAAPDFVRVRVGQTPSVLPDYPR